MIKQLDIVTYKRYKPFTYGAPRRTPSHVLPIYFRVPKLAFQATINLHTVHLVARRAHILRARGAHGPIFFFSKNHR